MNARPGDTEAASPNLPDDAVEVGRVTDAWGIKGGIKVLPYSSQPQALFSTKRWYLLAPETRYLPKAAREAGAHLRWPVLLKVIQAREQGDGVVATAQDLSDRNAAEALKGARVFVSRSSFPTADPDEFYWVDLIGLQVVNRDQRILGKVSDLLDTGAHSILRVQGSSPDGQPFERLIPFVAAFIDAVDLAAQRIAVDWAEDWDEPVATPNPAQPVRGQATRSAARSTAKSAAKKTAG